MSGLDAPSILALVLVPALAAVAVFAVTRVERFLVLGVTSALIVPTALVQPGGAQVALADLLLIATVLAWLVAGTVRHVSPPWIRGNPLLVPGLLFVGVNLASLLWTTSARSTFVFVVQTIEIVIVFPIVFASLPRSARDLRHGMYLFVGCTLVLATLTIVNYVPEAAAGNLQGRDLSFDFNKNVTGSFVGAGTVMAYCLWLGATDRRERRILLTATLVNALGLAMTVSRGSILGGAAAVILASFLLGRARRGTLVSVAAGVLAYLTLIGGGSQVDLSDSGAYDSSTVRKYSFANGWEAIQERPILGTGGGTYFDYIEEIQLPITDPNNLFILTWAELGIFGLLAMGFLLLRLIRLLLRVRHLDLELATPAVAAGCVSVSMFVHFQFDVTWTRGTTTLAFAMMGVMLAALRIAGAARSGPSPDTAPPAAARRSRVVA